MRRSPLFSSRVVTGLVVVASISFLLAFVLSAFGNKLDAPRSYGADGYSVSAVGHAAWIELMQGLGVGVEQRRHRRHSAPPPSVLVALEPRARDAKLADELYALAEQRGGALVIVAPKWRGLPSFERRGWINEPSLVDLEGFNAGLYGLVEVDLEYDGVRVVQRDEEFSSSTGRQVECESAAGESLSLFTRNLQYLEIGTDWTPWLTCDGEVVVAWVEYVDLWVVADPEPFNNAGLAMADNARFSVALFGDQIGAETLLVDETIHGHGFEDSLLAQWLGFPLGLAIAHGLLVVGLFVWHGSRRFGFRRPVDTERIDGRQVLVDNAARLLTMGLHSRAALLAYYEQTIRDVATRFPVRRDATIDTLVGYLQPLSESRGSTLQLAALQRSIVGLPESGRIPAERITRIARRLHAWRTEMIDGHRTDR